MADLQQYTQFVRIGRQADRTTVCPFDVGDYKHASDTNRWRDMVTLPDGLSGGISNPFSPFATQHRLRGALYINEGNKNFEPGTITIPLTPENMLFVLELMKVTNDQLDYYTIEEYWTSTLGGSADKGRQLVGCIFTGINLSLSREAGGGLQAQLSFFLNQDLAIPSSATIPSFTPPPASVGMYNSLGVLIDLVETTGSFENDIPAIRSLDIAFSHNVTVSDPRGHATAGLDRVWTRHALGEPSLTCSARFRVDDDNYLDWARRSPRPAFQLRVGIFSKGSTYNVLDTLTVLAGNAGQTVSLSDVTGLDDGDVLLITDGTKFTVSAVSGVTTGPDAADLDDASDCAFTAESVAVYNGAWELRFPRIELTQPGQKAANGAFEEVTHQFSAFLLAGETELWSYKAYNDDNT